MPAILSFELFAFLSFFICGVCVSMLFDFFRALRKVIKMNNPTVHITDCFFWIGALGISCFCVFFLNDGLLRTFVIISFLLGIVLYFFTLSRLFFMLFLKIIEIICHFINLFFKILLTPLKFSYKIIVVCFSRIKNKFKSGV